MCIRDRDETDESQREEYKNLTEDELAVLLNDPEVEVIEHTAPGDTADSAYGETSSEGHHVVIKRTNYNGRIRIENVPPSEFLIARDAKNIKDSRFVCHRVQKTLSELREMYPDKDLDSDELGGGDEDFDALSGERSARFAFDESDNFGFRDSEPEDALKLYWLHESFLKTDFDGDGIAELRKVCTVCLLYTSPSPRD